MGKNSVRWRGYGAGAHSKQGLPYISIGALPAP